MPGRGVDAQTCGDVWVGVGPRPGCSHLLGLPGAVSASPETQGSSCLGPGNLSGLFSVVWELPPPDKLVRSLPFLSAPGRGLAGVQALGSPGAWRQEGGQHGLCALRPRGPPGGLRQSCPCHAGLQCLPEGSVRGGPGAPASGCGQEGLHGSWPALASWALFRRPASSREPRESRPQDVLAAAATPCAATERPLGSRDAGTMHFIELQQVSATRVQAMLWNK